MRLTNILAFDPSKIFPKYKKYYRLALENSEILFVDNRAKLKIFFNHFETNKQLDLIGIDCEWKPSTIKGVPESPISIMQISTRKNIFLIDLLALSEVINKEFSEHLMQLVFLAPNLTKIG